MIRFGFGAALAIVFLAAIGRRAMAREQTACLMRKLAGARLPQGVGVTWGD